MVSFSTQPPDKSLALQFIKDLLQNLLCDRTSENTKMNGRLPDPRILL